MYFGTTEPLKASAPDADPDKDGFTNLQEYELGEDPTRKNPVYEAGFVWDEIPKALSTVDPKKQNHIIRVNFNHYPDKNGKLVHGFLYTKDNNFDGDYPYMNKWNNKGKYLGWSLRNWSKFHYSLGENGGIKIEFIPEYKAIYRFWSPVAGRFNIKTETNTSEKMILRIQQGAKLIKEIALAPNKENNLSFDLDLKRRDKLDFILVPQVSKSFKVVFKPTITFIKK